MLNITAKLRKHLTEKFSLKADASDAEARELVMAKVMAGEFDTKTLADLTAAEATEAEGRVEAMVAKAMAPFADQFTKALAALGTKPATPAETEADVAAKAAAAEATKAAERKELVTKMASLHGISEAEAEAKLATAGLGAKGYAMAAAGGAVDPNGDTFARIKSVVERYDHTPTAALRRKGMGGLTLGHDGRPLAENMPVTIDTGDGDNLSSRSLNMPTERSKAIAGAWIKWLGYKHYKATGRSIPTACQLSERDRQLIQYAAHECKFVGPIGFSGDPGVLDDGGAMAWCDGNRLDEISGKSFDLLRKSILDDALSGGLEAVPIEFDDNFILTPLLEGELFPLVTLRNVSRRRIEATKFGNFRLTWGTAEGTTIDLFDTDGFISGFDTNIHPVTGATLVGLDFLADSPLNVGSILVGEWGKAFRKEMDDVVAYGNGTDRPTGIFRTTGFNSVTSAGGAGAAPEIGDYESLYFSIPKQYRTEAGARFIYCGTDTTYRRARGIPVDSSNDARRLFGTDNQENYLLFGNRSFRVTQATGVTNAMIAGVMINRYRMYRRQGAEIRIVTEDAGLARTNEQLMLIRARFGGQFEDAAAMARIADAQA